MSLGQTFHSAANLLQERAPGLDTGLSNVFRLNAANLPDTGNDAQARLGLASLQNSNSVASFGNTDFSSKLMGNLNMAEMERATVAPSIAPGMGQ
jgi:hypothetical protein